MHVIKNRAQNTANFLIHGNYKSYYLIQTSHGVYMLSCRNGAKLSKSVELIQPAKPQNFNTLTTKKLGIRPIFITTNY